MASRDLPRFVPPPPPPAATCDGCGSMARECLVPNGDGSLAMCWMCAHAVVDHGVEVPGLAAWYEGAPCGCASGAVYPTDICERLASRAPEVAAPPAPAPELMSLHHAEFGDDGRRTGRTYRVDYERIAPDVVRVVNVYPPDHGSNVSRGMRAARAARRGSS